MQLPITVISAGAGSGKTYSLTQRLVKMLGQGVRPSGIIATTFTKKAAAELQDRVRVKLLEEGLTDAANELGEALIGTVHSIGTRLLQRFAFEAGVSPLVEIMAEDDSDRMFNESLAQVLTEPRIEQLNQLADRLGLSKKNFNEDGYDWRRDLHQITDVARANNFSIEILQKSKQLSWETFSQFLPEPLPLDPLTWQNRLIAHLEQATAALQNNNLDTTKDTQNTILVLQNVLNHLKYRGELHWHEWIKISKLKTGAKSRELIEPLREFAVSHWQHEQFHQDIRQFIFLIFEVAIDALHEFEQYKKKRGLIDYTDMETQVSQLLRNPDVCATLQSELDLLLVDEFQDTSPIQLDIFLRLSRLAQHSIWVGDPKQSIYGFRGAEPALMQAIIEKTGGVQPENILGKSWRSREDIVRAVNAIFVKAFPQFPPEQVVLEPVRTREKEPPNTPLALMHWHFKSEMEEKRPPGAPWLENCIAHQILVLLERQLPILPKSQKKYRPVQPGDIAILCRSNDACIKMAEALHRAGLKASIARAGLLDTREARLVVACLKFLLSPSDALSIAEIRLLASGEPLETIVNDRLHYLHKKREDENYHERWSAGNNFVQKLLEFRQKTGDLSASELLSLLIDELDLRRVVVTLGNAAQRLDNLDTLRRFAFEYENACTRLHSAATLGGFLLWLDALHRQKADLQGSGESSDAVRVMTYHKSKGLEFPVTICHALGGELREKVWGLNLVSETKEVDLENILAHRWLRFWVNPYADQLKNTPLAEAVENSEPFANATRAALEEDARLLYVGLTRARDYLIFPTTSNPTKWLNRVFNHGDCDVPTLDPHSNETPFYHGNFPLEIATEVIYMPKDFPSTQVDEPPTEFHAPRAGTQHHIPLRIDPQQFPTDEGWHLDLPTTFGAVLTIENERVVPLHHAVKAVFWADSLKYPSAERLSIAQHQLKLRDIAPQNFDVQLLLRQSELFFLFIKNQFQPTQLHRAVSVEMWHEERWLEMPLDFLIENEHQIIGLQFAPAADPQKNAKNTFDRMTAPLAWLHQFLEKKCNPAKKEVQVWAVAPELGVMARLMAD